MGPLGAPRRRRGVAAGAGEPASFSRGWRCAMMHLQRGWRCALFTCVPASPACTKAALGPGVSPPVALGGWRCAMSAVLVAPLRSKKEDAQGCLGCEVQGCLGCEVQGCIRRRMVAAPDRMMH